MSNAGFTRAAQAVSASDFLHLAGAFARLTANNGDPDGAFRRAVLIFLRQALRADP